MPTLQAQDILNKASILLQDTTNVRWPQAELIGWLNDAMREITAVRPDQASKYVTIPLTAGTRQTLPTDAIELMRVVRNIAADGVTPGMAIRKVPQELLDSQIPNWHSTTPSGVIRHFTYDGRDPHHFYVYPPADGTTKVEVLYNAPPVKLNAYTDTIVVDDIFANIALDYVMFRAYSKDLEEAGNAQRAQMHQKMFTDGLAAKSTADGDAAPKDQVKG